MFSKSLILSSILLSMSADGSSLKNEFATPPSEYRVMINTHGWQLTNTNFMKWLGDRHAGGSVIDAQVAAVPGEEHCINPQYLDDPVVFQNLRDTMTVWVTADHRHIPVRMKSKVAVSSFVAELKN